MDKKIKTKDTSEIKKSNKLWKIFLIIIFLIGAAIRLYDLTDAPLDFHPTRQLHSALIARGMYFQHLEKVPEWQRERAINQWTSEGLIEPQIMETLTALGCRLIGSDQLWIARLWAIIFWMTGGVFIFLTNRKLSGLPATVTSLSYFLFWPYAAIASRAFQPEALMVMMISAGIWAACEWLDRKNIWWAIVTGLLCGLSIYIKSVAVFFIAPALAGLILSNYSISKAIKNRQIWVIFILSILPYALYHFYGVFVLQLLGEQFSLRFFPQLWIDPVFYIKWSTQVFKVVGLEIMLASIFGFLTFSKKKYFGMICGLFLGYLVYGFAFSYHVSTHDYYHLPLFIPITFGIALLIDGLFKSIRKEQKNHASLVLAIILIIFVGQKTWLIRTELKKVDYRNEVTFWQNLGRELGYDKKVTGLLPDYGYRLAYWGWMNVSPWMQTTDINLRELAGKNVDYQNALASNVGNHDYFIITEMDELKRQGSLENYLRTNYSVYSESDALIIFDLRGKTEN